jgi:hypothetical protein
MDLTQLVEQRIQQAMRRGEFDDLPGQGKPLELGPALDSGQRLYQTVLKNNGIVPPEVELFNRREALRRALRDAEDDAQRTAIATDLAGVQTELDVRLGRIGGNGAGGAHRYQAVRSAE